MFQKSNCKKTISLAAILGVTAICSSSISFAESVPVTITIPASEIDIIVDLEPVQTGDGAILFPYVIGASVSLLALFLIITITKAKKKAKKENDKF